MEYQKEIKIKSAVPVYLAGVAWVLYAVCFPLYRWGDFICAALASAIVYILSGFIFKGETIFVEQEIETGSEYLDVLLNSLRLYTKKLKEIMENIRQSDMHTSVHDLATVTESIFDFVFKNPEKADRIRQFENYLLPTTCELLNAYMEMESQHPKGDNIQKAMKEIEGAMPNLKKAYHQISDDLYQDKAVDISAEIEVLKSIIGEKTLDFQIAKDGRNERGENSNTADESLSSK